MKVYFIEDNFYNPDIVLYKLDVTESRNPHYTYYNIHSAKVIYTTNQFLNKFEYQQLDTRYCVNTLKEARIKYLEKLRQRINMTETYLKTLRSELTKVIYDIGS